MKKTSLILFALILNALPLSSFGVPTDAIAYGQGLPLPWPFPWAKECEVHWESIPGRYALSDNAAHEEMELKITFIKKFGVSLVRVKRISNDGILLSEGLTAIYQGQRSFRLRLEPHQEGQPVIWASLKFYYGGRELRCDDSYLVPILALEKEGFPNNQRTEYRLIKQDGN